MIRSPFLGLWAGLLLAAAAGSGAYAADDSLTWQGFTLYGLVDAGIANQTHGAPFNRDSTQGLNYTVGKSSGDAVTSRAVNGLAPSFIGLKGDFKAAQDVSAIFNLQTGFDPLSLHLDNGPRSLVDNNGRPWPARHQAAIQARRDRYSIPPVTSALNPLSMAR